MSGREGGMWSRGFGSQVEKKGTVKMAEQQDGRSLGLRMFTGRRKPLLCLCDFPGGSVHSNTTCVLISLA